MNRRTFLALTAIATLAACQTIPESELPPRNYTFDASKSATKEALVGSFLQRGYQLKSDSDLTLVFDRPASDNMLAMMAFGSNWNVVPNARVRVTLTGDNPTRVFTDLSIITNPGTGFERPNDFNNNLPGRQAVQYMVNTAKSRLKTGG